MTATSWETKPYHGGGPAKVKGFPRALYPPDVPASSGHEPSSRGPDVVAYKRTICRLGRWGDWDPDAWDDGYWTNFAHGKEGGGRPWSGVRGVQWQQQLDVTGWLGKKTFDALRYALVPDDPAFPHAGEQAMDAVACDLIDEAYAMFAGKQTSEPTGKLKRKAMPSPNYSSRGGSSVRLIVLHTAEGATTIESLGNYFANASADVSSHVGIDDKDGTIGEYVKRGNKAWTASNANPVAVQAELCAFAAWSRAEWNKHPKMLENTARWIAEEAAAFDLPLTNLSPTQAQGNGRGVCQHNDLGSWGGGHWDCGNGFPMDDVLKRAKELA